MATTRGRLAGLYLASGASIGMVNEAMTADATRTIYTITNAAKRYWDPATPLVFQRSLDSGGSWNPVTPDGVQLVGGVITFAVAQQAAPPAQLRVSSGSYLPNTALGGGYEWSFTPEMALLESTEFGQTSKRYTPTTVAAAKATLKRWWLDGTMLPLRGQVLVLACYVDASAAPAGPRYEAYVLLDNASEKAAAQQLVGEDLAFTATSDFYFRAV